MRLKEKIKKKKKKKKKNVNQIKLWVSKWKENHGFHKKKYQKRGRSCLNDIMRGSNYFSMK